MTIRFQFSLQAFLDYQRRVEDQLNMDLSHMVRQLFSEYVNLEGRVQSAAKAIEPVGQALPGYEIMSRIAGSLDQTLFESNDDRLRELNALLSVDAAAGRGGR